MDEKKEEIASVQVAEVDTESTSGSSDEKSQARYLEVEAATVVEDDETMPAETFRAYVIGIILTFFGSLLSNVTGLREEPLVIQPEIIQLLALPIGRVWARWMPSAKLRMGPWSMNLNPGTFTVKEHTLISMMANVGVGEPPYAIDLIIAQIMKYKLNFGFPYNFMLVMGSEMIGYGLAGLCRRWLVYPPDLIWPRALLTSNFLNTMHRDVNNPIGRWTISRYKLFFIAGIGCFAYQSLPQFISFLRSFPILPMIWPKSKIVNTLFGPNLGLALLSMTLSWQTVVTFLDNPLIVPAEAHFNIFGGMVFWFWIVTGIMYMKNYWWSQFFAIGSPGIFTNTIQKFYPEEVMTEDGVFELDAYKKYSPLFQGPRIALAYALSFASISCLLVHSILYDGMTILKGFRSQRWDDVHLQKMRKYPEAPEWWYQVLLLSVFALSMVGVLVYPTFLPWWGFLLTMLFPIIFTIPIGIIQARTNQQLGLNVITEFLAGYLWPGRPIANTLVKIYGYMSMTKALLFVCGLKLGIYMKIPPRATFRFQVVGSFVSCLTALGILDVLPTSDVRDGPMAY